MTRWLDLATARCESRDPELARALRGRRAALDPARSSDRSAVVDPMRAAFQLESAERTDAGSPVYVANAGLVLAGAFLPRMFDVLGLLGEDGRFEDWSAASRGVHLLQYLVDERTDAPEPLLVLNKVLCGVPSNAPVEPSIEPTPTELDVCDTMLRSILARWEAISSSSPASLRTTFLQRDGRLTSSDEGWRLVVDRKTVDVLVDQIPWSIGVVYHRWMHQAVTVTW